ncbi:hypothetical protein [Bradyrhizobium ottawaense]|uniref:hypothetical protein n=1 Tax=Bradyrhizobium ottawaense TaxID=931866 RepID=UPI003F9FFC44
MINIIYLLLHALDIARSRLLEGIILVRRRRRPAQSISRAKKELFELQLGRPKQPVRIFTHRRTSDTVRALCNKSGYREVSCLRSGVGPAPRLQT